MSQSTVIKKKLNEVLSQDKPAEVKTSEIYELMKEVRNLGQYIKNTQPAAKPETKPEEKATPPGPTDYVKVIQEKALPPGPTD